MRISTSVILVTSPLLLSAAFWACFGACVGGCIDAPADPPEPIARIHASWDPSACGAPHRVVVDLEDDDGAPLAGSVPCNRGGLTLEATHFGRYRGRIFAWTLGEPDRAEVPVDLIVDAQVVHWLLSTPP